MTDFLEDSCEEIKVDADRTKRVKESMVSDAEAALISELFRILGDPTRIRIIYALSIYEMCVCDIAEVLGMTQSAISHQLRLLRTMKLVKSRKEGKSVIYSLDDEHILNLFSQGMEHIRHK